MAHPTEKPILDEQAEAERRLAERRRRLERIAQRYEQLEEKLESLEALMSQYSPRAAEEAGDEANDRPRKPR
jgi:acyl carrier protein phosphodiesterase